MNVRNFVAATLLSGISLSTFAAPVTFEFTATVTNMQNTGTNTRIEGLAGEVLTGTYTFDLLNARSSYPDYVETHGGCSIAFRDSCDGEPNARPHLVTSYSATMNGYSWSSTEILSGAIFTHRIFSTDELKSIDATSWQRFYSNSPGITGEFVTRFSLTAKGNFGPSSLSDFTGVADLSQADLGQVIISNYWERCPYDEIANMCAEPTTYSGFAVYATLTSWTRVADTSEVPEPASLALIGLGLAGLAAARRRMATRRGRVRREQPASPAR